jgi:hypothetical protein
MRRSIKAMLAKSVIALAVGAALAYPVRANESDDLKATPGLWKVTYRTQPAGQPDPAVVKWQCVSEKQMDDPATAFAMPPTLQATCKRTDYSQTSKMISWRHSCVSNSGTLHSEGSIAFDTPLHYAGKINIEGVVMGYPIANTIEVEGVHRAACTSPED